MINENIVQMMSLYESVGDWIFIQYDNDKPKWEFRFHDYVLN